MKKTVLCAASCYIKKYHIEPAMEKSLPALIKDEIKALIVSKAEKFHCVLTLGFYENGDIYFETMSAENDFDFDEIGSRLEIEKIKKEKAELLRSLSLWYRAYRSGLIKKGQNKK